MKNADYLIGYLYVIIVVKVSVWLMVNKNSVTMISNYFLKKVKIG